MSRDEDDKPTQPPLYLAGGSEDPRPRRERPRRRKTPSAPMAALDPKDYDNRPDASENVVLDQSTRDELLLKFITRVERIDAESELVVETLKSLSEQSEKNAKQLKFIRQDQEQLIGEVKALHTRMSTMTSLLRMALMGEKIGVETTPPENEESSQG